MKKTVNVEPSITEIRAHLNPDPGETLDELVERAKQAGYTILAINRDANNVLIHRDTFERGDA